MTMLIPSEYGTLPKSLTQARTQVKSVSPKRDQSGFALIKTILNDPNVTLVQMMKSVIHGTSLAIFLRAVMLNFANGPKQIVANRYKTNPIEVLRLFRFPAVFGAVGGLAWYMIYDGILCTHGQATLTKHLIAYGIAGGIVVGTLYNPASAFYGSILGTFWGLIKSGNNLPVLPANANFKFEDFDKQKRLKAERDDDEYQLSIKLRRAQQSNRLYVV